PLRRGDQILGAVFVDKALCGGSFTTRDLDLLVAICAQVATILENTRITQMLDLEVRQKEATLDAINDGVILVDTEYYVAACNKGALRQLGLAQLQRVPLSAVPALAFLRPHMERAEELDGRVVRIYDGEFLLNLRVVPAEEGGAAGHVITLAAMKRVQ